MPDEPTEQSAPDSSVMRCAGCSCDSTLRKCMQVCMNCKMDVDASMSRVGGRKMRKLMALPECSIDACAEFLLTVDDIQIRLHLASMAWWRFSSDNDNDKADRIRRIMDSCGRKIPEFGLEYVHDAMRVLSPLSQEQLSAWFGYHNLYQIAELFSGGIEEKYGKHCEKCALFRMGCTSASRIGSDDCPMWRDKFVQSVAKAVRKAGEWRDPCAGIDENGEQVK